MTKEEVINLIEVEISLMHPRTSGEDTLSDLMVSLSPFLVEKRQSVIGALRDYLSFRTRGKRRGPCDYISEARIWTAINLAVRLGITELIPDMAKVIRDTKKGRVLSPLYIDMLEKQLYDFRKSTQVFLENLDVAKENKNPFKTGDVVIYRPHKWKHRLGIETPLKYGTAYKIYDIVEGIHLVLDGHFSSRFHWGEFQNMPVFFLTLHDGYYDRENVYECKCVTRRNGYYSYDWMPITINPPLDGKLYGLVPQHNITTVAILSQNEEASLFPVRKYPIDVYVAQILVDSLEMDNRINGYEYTCFASAVLHRTREDAIYFLRQFANKSKNRLNPMSSVNPQTQDTFTTKICPFKKGDWAIYNPSKYWQKLIAPSAIGKPYEVFNVINKEYLYILEFPRPEGIFHWSTFQIMA